MAANLQPAVKWRLKMAERKKEDGGAKKCRRDKADSGYGARIKEAEKILAGEVNEVENLKKWHTFPLVFHMVTW